MIRTISTSRGRNGVTFRRGGSVRRTRFWDLATREIFFFMAVGRFLFWFSGKILLKKKKSHGVIDRAGLTLAASMVPHTVSGRSETRWEKKSSP
jgi:hypothetical protein